MVPVLFLAFAFFDAELEAILMKLPSESGVDDESMLGNGKGKHHAKAQYKSVSKDTYMYLATLPTSLGQSIPFSCTCDIHADILQSLTPSILLMRTWYAVTDSQGQGGVSLRPANAIQYLHVLQSHVPRPSSTRERTFLHSSINLKEVRRNRPSISHLGTAAVERISGALGRWSASKFLYQCLELRAEQLRSSASPYTETGRSPMNHAIMFWAWISCPRVWFAASEYWPALAANASHMCPAAGCQTSQHTCRGRLLSVHLRILSRSFQDVLRSFHQFILTEPGESKRVSCCNGKTVRRSSAHFCSSSGGYLGSEYNPLKSSTACSACQLRTRQSALYSGREAHLTHIHPDSLWRSPIKGSLTSRWLMLFASSNLSSSNASHAWRNRRSNFWPKGFNASVGMIVDDIICFDKMYWRERPAGELRIDNGDIVVAQHHYHMSLAIDVDIEPLLLKSDVRRRHVRTRHVTRLIYSHAKDVTVKRQSVYSPNMDPRPFDDLCLDITATTIGLNVRMATDRLKARPATDEENPQNDILTLESMVKLDLQAQTLKDLAESEEERVSTTPFAACRWSLEAHPAASCSSRVIRVICDTTTSPTPACPHALHSLLRTGSQREQYYNVLVPCYPERPFTVPRGWQQDKQAVENAKTSHFFETMHP
ncbi:uncharacterized protein MYCFIDRAFT_177393 [Pseudocercospora fijiensis CIRAD86]|uniref:Uncharacterized protein n=1 Tax=Pseudocercospora fijiensis (strain CIRAD86) TaxID=383855 RepID=M2ZMW6_PSEFD|nr:uncharacterized protein MYCFIDRAFT_177393 [Pseudocercospora fijiensis CIRAD86]EME80454.1 hypothetical protein MYCFIDRAFT_177393 [Pseudocercospora fijiensis CIRAD86]